MAAIEMEPARSKATLALIVRCPASRGSCGRGLPELAARAAKKFDVGVLMTSRLAPDMQHFIYQVQSACDYVKAAAAWLSGQTPPKHEDNEKTIDELRARIRKTVAFAETVTEAQAARADGVMAVLLFGLPAAKDAEGSAAWARWALPVWSRGGSCGARARSMRGGSYPSH